MSKIWAVETKDEFDDRTKWLDRSFKWTFTPEEAIGLADFIDAQALAKLAMKHCVPPVFMYPIEITRECN